MTINGFIWDQDNMQHIAWHQIAPSEAEEILENEFFVTKERYGRNALFGVTNAGRCLVVVIERRDNDYFRVVTAYQMSVRQRDFYLDSLKKE
jgi:uncharacterized protein